MIKRSGFHGHETWSCPGGHLDYGEDPFECAKRETDEEVGISIQNLRFKGITNDMFNEGKHYITIWIESDYESGSVRVNAKNELTQVGWYSFENLPKPLFQSMQNYIDGHLIKTS